MASDCGYASPGLNTNRSIAAKTSLRATKILRWLSIDPSTSALNSTGPTCQGVRPSWSRCSLGAAPMSCRATGFNVIGGKPAAPGSGGTSHDSGDRALRDQVVVDEDSDMVAGFDRIEFQRRACEHD